MDGSEDPAGRAPDAIPLASLALEGVRAGYRGRAALGPVDVALSTGVYALLGRNGAGKTTLMRVMAGILAPLSGRVLIGGTDLAARPEAKDQVAYLGHRAAVSMDLTVRRHRRLRGAL